MITIKTFGTHLNHLFCRDRNLRMCFADAKVAVQVRDRMNAEIKAKLNQVQLKRVA